MSKLAVIYWTGTGNTGAMAQAVADGAKGAGAEAELLTVSEISADAAAAYDKLALGCPAMGAEVLEEGSSSPSSPLWRASCPGRRWPCSALTAGATDSGCGSGRSGPRRPAPSSAARG